MDLKDTSYTKREGSVAEPPGLILGDPFYPDDGWEPDKPFDPYERDYPDTGWVQEGVGWGHPDSDPLEDMKEFFRSASSGFEMAFQPYVDFFQKFATIGHQQHVHYELNGKVLKNGMILPERKFNHGPARNPYTKHGRGKK